MRFFQAAGVLTVLASLVFINTACQGEGDESATYDATGFGDALAPATDAAAPGGAIAAVRRPTIQKYKGILVHERNVQQDVSSMLTRWESADSNEATVVVQYTGASRQLEQYVVYEMPLELLNQLAQQGGLDQYGTTFAVVNRMGGGAAPGGASPGSGIGNGGFNSLGGNNGFGNQGGLGAGGW